MRAIAPAFEWGHDKPLVKAWQACAHTPRCLEAARRGTLSFSAATRLSWRRRREPMGGLRCRFGSEGPA